MPRQLDVGHGLRTEREAGHAGHPEAEEIAQLIGPGIGLERHLGAGGDGEPPVDRLEQRPHLLRSHERGRASTQVDAGQRHPNCPEGLVQDRCSQLELPLESA